MKYIVHIVSTVSWLSLSSPLLFPSNHSRPGTENISRSSAGLSVFQGRNSTRRFPHHPFNAATVPVTISNCTFRYVAEREAEREREEKKERKKAHNAYVAVTIATAPSVREKRGEVWQW